MLGGVLSDGYKIIMRDDGLQFGLASSGFPNDKDPISAGWYGSLLIFGISEHVGRLGSGAVNARCETIGPKPLKLVTWWLTGNPEESRVFGKFPRPEGARARYRKSRLN